MNPHFSEGYFSPPKKTKKMNPELFSKLLYVEFIDHWYSKDDVFVTDEPGIKIVVLETPKRKWYKKLLQWLTFG